MLTTGVELVIGTKFYPVFLFVKLNCSQTEEFMNRGTVRSCLLMRTLAFSGKLRLVSSNSIPVRVCEKCGGSSYLSLSAPKMVTAE